MMSKLCKKKDFSFLNRSSVGCISKTCFDHCSLVWIMG